MRSLGQKGVGVRTDELEAVVSSRMGRSYRLVPLSVKCTFPVFRGEADGGPSVFVKLGFREDWERMSRMSEILGPTGFAARMLTGTPPECGGHSVFIMTWMEGETVFPECMNDRQVDSFVGSCNRLSGALQSASGHVRVQDGWHDPERLYAVVAGYARRHPLCGRVMADLLGVPAGRRTLGAHARAVIHGDFHAKNFAFRGDTFAAVFDFGGVREGLACGDLVNALVERFSCLNLGADRRRRLRQRARVILSRAVWPREELEIAVNVLRLEFAARRIEKHPDALWVALDVERRDRKIREILECLPAAAGEGTAA